MDNISDFYIAGFIDGEANIRMRKRNNRKTPYVEARIQIANRHKGVLDAIQRRFGGTLAEYPNGTNTIWRLEWYNLAEIGNLLRHILPYLIVKKAQAELLLQYIQLRKNSKSYTQEQWSIVDQLAHV